MTSSASTSELLKIKAEAFSDVPKASTLNLINNVASQNVRDVTVRIWQNHAAASFGMFAQKYAELWGFSLNILDVGYDDSFSFTGAQAEYHDVDFHLVWVDIDRIEGATQFDENWFAQRIEYLSSVTTGRIVIVPSSKRVDRSEEWSATLAQISGISVVNPWSSREGTKASESVIAERLAKITGSYLSTATTLQLARDITCQYFLLPQSPPLKLIIVDLDWTMYAGVLREDGATGIRFDEEHQALWDLLATAQKAGVMLGVVSRNEENLVNDFFSIWENQLPVKRDDFISVIAITEGTKLSAISSIIDLARTTARDTVFIDDNIGEMSEVVSALPDLKAIIGNMGFTTVNWLENTPGISWGHVDENAQTRLQDIKARERRELAAGDQAQSTDDFLSGLDIKISISLNNQEELDRLADMVQRTNQFNSNSRRTTRHEIEEMIASGGAVFATAALSDAFVDSGIILGILALPTSGSRLQVENLVMSCRAMGRGLEPVIIGATLERLLNFSQHDGVEITWNASERNKPFREFAQLVDQHIDIENDLSGTLYLTPHVLEKLQETKVKLQIHPIN